MPSKIVNQYGSVNVDDTVIATIAGMAAMECYGLVGMASRNATDGLVKLLKKEHLTKGVKVSTVENKVSINLYIVVQFGVKISVVANNIIDKVKYNIENMTGMEVERINVYVQGVRVQK
ncbi:Asp23/Gls24 family envelope stress response protein [Clostridiisalibacter paucivorans]|uniref:Asp23/Gls24 family envelope stress response protein n=1 Tax=Clostridiisalibacter paucivorans TaxID=408753 RepID=UPI00047E7808|nr:Asp23/Gls24 family envelope stress response protein [Clostridiisalibacter paucivorans]